MSAETDALRAEIAATALAAGPVFDLVEQASGAWVARCLSGGETLGARLRYFLDGLARGVDLPGAAYAAWSVGAAADAPMLALAWAVASLASALRLLLDVRVSIRGVVRDVAAAQAYVETAQGKLVEALRLAGVARPAETWTATLADAKKSVDLDR